MKQNKFPWKRVFRWLAKGLLSLAAAGAVALYFLMSAPAWSSEVERIVIQSGTSEYEVIARLRSEGFIRSTRAFDFILALGRWHNKIQPGGYRISKSMNAWKIARILAHDPYMQWISVPEGLRKEEIAEIFKKKLAWDEVEAQAFLNPPRDVVDFPASEGYYFPDTYLISVDEGGARVAARMFAQFNEKFAPYYNDFIHNDIKHTTGVSIASLLEREAAGPEDMPIISGILWNRLLQGMRLDIDATLQYARGKTQRGWWSPIKSSDKNIDSPYNTYRNAGLPPTPISNPGLTAILAALHPAETQCLFYLHGSDRKIHCAKTYADHLKNIEKYLRS